MSRSQKKKYISIQFEGGMQSFSSPHYRKDNQSKLLLNWSPRIPGELNKENGVSILGTGVSTGDPKGLGVFALENGTNHLIRLHGQFVDYWNGSAWVNIASGLNNNNTDIAIFAEAYVNNTEAIYIATGLNDTVKYWDGTTFSAIANTYARHVEEYQNKIYLANIKLTSTAYPIRLIWSDIGTNTFNTAINFIDDVGEPITGLKKFASRLHVFSENQLFAFDGSSLRNIAGNFGTTSARTIQITNGAMYWFNRQGVFRYDGVNIPTLISRPVQDWIDAMASAVNISAWIDEFGRYCLQLGSGTITVAGDEYESPALVFDPYIEAWSVLDNQNFHSGTQIRSGGAFQSYGIKYNSNAVYTLNSGNNDINSNAVEASFISREFGVEDPEYTKNFYRIHVTFVPQNTANTLDLFFRLDGGSWVSVGSVSLAGTQQIKTVKINTPGKTIGNILEVKLVNDSAGSAIVQQVRVDYDVISTNL